MNRKKIGLILTGGYIDNNLLQDFLVTHEILWVIAVDKGLMAAHQLSLPVDVVIGDFDSVDHAVLSEYTNGSTQKKPVVVKLQPEKDMTDTQVALEYGIQLLENTDGEIALVGATGTRIDHMIANISLLSIPLSYGVKACILDRNNKVYLKKESFHISKKEAYGDYISLLPMNEEVTGLTLKGLKYPLDEYTLTWGNSLGISNEIVEKEAYISFTSGVLIVIEARD